MSNTDSTPELSPMAQQIAAGLTGPEPVAVIPRNPTEADLYDLGADWWNRSPMRTSIHTTAERNGGNPTAVVMIALARVAALTHPNVRSARIPSIPSHRHPGISPASLNLTVAVCGPSGSGKSSAFRASRGALNIADGDTPRDFLDGANPASGEGLAALFMRNPTDMDTEHNSTMLEVGDQTYVLRPHVFIATPEGSEIATRMGRQGSTLVPHFLKAAFGEDLGSQTVDQSKWRHVPEGKYSCGIAFGIQPDLAETFLTDTDSGLAQRVLWAPTVRNAVVMDDEWLDKLADAIKERPAMDVQPVGPSWKPPTPNVRFVLHREPMKAIWRSTGEHPDPADSHRGINHHKLACLLALLDNPGARGEIAITEQVWADAQQLMTVSDTVRTGIKARVERRQAEHAERIAIAKANEQIRIEQVKDFRQATRLDELAEYALAAIEAAGVDGATKTTAITRWDTAERKAHAEAVLASLVEEGRIHVVGEGRKRRFMLGPAG